MNEWSCQDCGGSGIDCGSLNMEYPDDCRTCNGSGCEPEPNKHAHPVFAQILNNFAKGAR